MPQCLGQSGVDQAGFAITMGAITAIKIASPSTIPNGQCQMAVQNLVARPFAQGILTVMPPVPAKGSLESLLKSDDAGTVLWNQFKALPPPVSTYASHVSCSCTLIDKSLSLADLSAFSNAVRGASKNCGKFLDDAGLGFINDFGTAAIEWTGGRYKDATGWWDEAILGQPDPAPDDVVYQMYWAPYEVEYANRILEGTGSQVLRWSPVSNVSPDEVAVAMAGVVGSNWSMPNAMGEAAAKALSSCLSGKACHTSLPAIYKQCVTYYDDRKASAETARQRCDAFRDQRFGPAASALASQFKADIATRKGVDAELAALHSNFAGQWLWRLPRRPGYVAGQGGNGWAVEAARARLFADLGFAQPWGSTSRGAWDYRLTGVYAAAREVLPNVGWDPKTAVALAMQGARPQIDANLGKVWAEWEHWDATSRLAEWLPTQPFTGKYGCPADNSAGLASACEAKVVETYKQHCAGPVRDAHLLALTSVDLGFRLGARKDACLSAIQPVLAHAQALASPPARVGAAIAEFCTGEPARSDAQQRCSRRVSDEWADCALTALKEGKGAAAAEVCFEAYVQRERLKRVQGSRVPAAVAPAVAPPGSLGVPANVANPPPASPSATAPGRTLPSPVSERQAPVREAAPTGGCPAPAGRPEPAREAPAESPPTGEAAPTPARELPAASPALRLPANVLRLRPCPEGEERVTDEQGQPVCRPKAEPRGGGG
ncbi:MAG: hypothetical protein KatS3mg127_1810 [Silanimonas sp.]|nr:MAG: hypothetical protein KatS3mg127_1810 [Silanimonas sp.]